MRIVKKSTQLLYFLKKGYLYWWTTYVSMIHLLLCYFVIHLTYYYLVMLRKNVMWPSSLLLPCTHSYLRLEGYNSNTVGLLSFSEGFRKVLRQPPSCTPLFSWQFNCTSYLVDMLSFLCFWLSACTRENTYTLFISNQKFIRISRLLVFSAH